MPPSSAPDLAGLTFAVLGGVHPVIIVSPMLPNDQLSLAAKDPLRLAGECGEAEPAERSGYGGCLLPAFPPE